VFSLGLSNLPFNTCYREDALDTRLWVDVSGSNLNPDVIGADELLVLPDAFMDPIGVETAPQAGAIAVGFRKLFGEDGLSFSKVLAITMDDQGFMWFGTQYGLNRFNAMCGTFGAFLSSDQKKCVPTIGRNTLKGRYSVNPNTVERQRNRYPLGNRLGLKIDGGQMGVVFVARERIGMYGLTGPQDHVGVDVFGAQQVP